MPEFVKKFHGGILHEYVSTDIKYIKDSESFFTMGIGKNKYLASFWVQFKDIPSVLRGP